MSLKKLLATLPRHPLPPTAAPSIYFVCGVPLDLASHLNPFVNFVFVFCISILYLVFLFCICILYLHPFVVGVASRSVPPSESICQGFIGSWHAPPPHLAAHLDQPHCPIPHFCISQNCISHYCISLYCIYNYCISRYCISHHYIFHYCISHYCISHYCVSHCCISHYRISDFNVVEDSTHSF